MIDPQAEIIEAIRLLERLAAQDSWQLGVHTIAGFTQYQRLLARRALVDARFGNTDWRRGYLAAAAILKKKVKM